MDKKQMIETLKANEDPGRAIQMKTYMRNQFEFLGIPAEKRKRLAQPFMKEAKKSEGVDWELLKQLWDEPCREFQYTGCAYLWLKHKELNKTDIPAIKSLALTKPWWDTIDSIDKVINQIALRDPEVNGTLLLWSKSENMWLRRIAIIHQRLRKENTDVELLEKILISNLGSSEFFINKAIGWSLRSYSKTNPEWVKRFINKHRDHLNSLSIREGSKYL